MGLPYNRPSELIQPLRLTSRLPRSPTLNEMIRRMDSKTQPILCCIGESVAAQPTQFLMERAFASQALDWRALTVEVAAEEFSDAVRGTWAMHFHALRLFAPLDVLMLDEMQVEDPAARFVGRVTSAALGKEAWEVWDNVGFATFELGTSRYPDGAAGPPTIWWMHGNTAQNRSLFSAFCALGQFPERWLWTEAPQEFPTELLQVIPAEQFDERCFAEGTELGLKLLQQWLLLTSNEASSNEVAETEADDAQSESQNSTDASQMGESNSDQTPERPALFIIGDAVPVAAGVKEILSASSARHALTPDISLAADLAEFVWDRIAAAELAVAQEAYDFHRWTGQVADLNLLRDAYDEYSDF